MVMEKCFITKSSNKNKQKREVLETSELTEGLVDGQVGLDVVEGGARALIPPEHHKVRGQLQGHIPTPVQSGCAGVQGGRGGKGEERRGSFE